jgi:hypothetical protein
MTLTLDLPPDLETRLNTEANRKELDAASYALRLLAASLPSDTASEWERRLRTFVDSLPRPAAPLSDSATTRAAFYQDVMLRRRAIIVRRQHSEPEDRPTAHFCNRLKPSVHSSV